jgi:L-arabinose isomerase
MVLTTLLATFPVRNCYGRRDVAPPASEMPVTTRPRVALVEPYWDFWEASVAFDLRADRAALAASVRAALDVEWCERDAADAVLVLQTMATPPAWTLPELGELPVVVWAAHRGGGSLDAAFDHGAITSEGATVGAPMLTSLLVRAGRPFEIVLGRIDDPAALARVGDALAAASAARRLGRARIGRVGAPLAGYDCVDTDAELLRAATGIELVAIAPGELTELYASVEEERVRELERETRSVYDVELEGEGLTRSLRAACALDDLVARHRLDAGAMNCHVPEIRFGDAIGITPCFALGRSTTAGVPWTCVGDVLTAVAMLAGKLLGGAAQYHELEAVDYATGELVLASSGEFDLALAPAARPRLIANGWFAADACQGACACVAAAPGPATLIGFAQVGDAYRLIAAEGAFSGRAFPATGTANGGFTFDRGLDGWTAWCRAGANHHSSATPGAYGPRLEALARFLGIEAVCV